jgi:pimeloyl-ACP methyl ester carboxylesterase
LPATLLLAHGAGSGPWIFEDWPDSFPGVELLAVDLQAGVEVGGASMLDYAGALVSAAEGLTHPIGLVGWSSGGLAALLAAEQIRPSSLVLLEASPPSEVQGSDADLQIGDGLFDPEAVYGPFPPGVWSRPESIRARGERKRGLSVPAVPCPALVVYGHEFPEERGRALVALYGAEELSFPDLDHWGLVLDARVRQAIARWLVGNS